MAGGSTWEPGQAQWDCRWPSVPTSNEIESIDKGWALERAQLNFKALGRVGDGEVNREMTEAARAFVADISTRLMLQMWLRGFSSRLAGRVCSAMRHLLCDEAAGENAMRLGTSLGPNEAFRGVH